MLDNLILFLSETYLVLYFLLAIAAITVVPITAVVVAIIYLRKENKRREKTKTFPWPDQTHYEQRYDQQDR